MSRLRVYFIFVIISLSLLEASSAPRKRRTRASKPALAWVKDNSKLFTIQQSEALNDVIKNLKDSLKSLPSIYIVTQNNYAIKSPYFRAFQSTNVDGKWYVSEAKDYGNDFVILVIPRGKTIAEPQLQILCNKSSSNISRFVSVDKLNRIQNEYNKYLNETPNAEQFKIVENLIGALSSRFFDGKIRDYNQILSVKDENEITRSIKTFTDTTKLKVAVVTSSSKEGEDSVFGKTLMINDKETKLNVEYKNLNADIVFVFYPNGVYVFSNVDKGLISDKALRNLTSKYTLPHAKKQDYKQAVQASLTALQAHIKEEALLDGMSFFEKMLAIILGITIPLGFCWFIFKNSFKKGKDIETNGASKPQTRKTERPATRQPISKPTKKETKPKPQQIEQQASTVVSVPTHILPLLKLSKPSEGLQDRGWTIDNTASLSVVMSKIDDLFKPISPRNEHEKMMLEMIDYMRLLREYTDQEIAYSLGIGGVSLYLDEVYGAIDPAAVRIVFNRALDLLIKNYAERDPRVSKYVSTTRS